MSLTFKNPFNEEKKKVALDDSLSNQEKDERIQELDLKSSQWIKEKIKLVKTQIKDNEDFVEQNINKVNKINKSDVRKIYQETIKRSRDIKKLYDDMRELNKQVREILFEK